MKRFILFIFIVFFLFLENLYAFEMEEIFVHGFLTQGYMKSDGNNFIHDQDDGTFNLREIGINFTCSPTSQISTGIQLFAFDYGEIGQRKIEVDWALINWAPADWIEIKAGILKIPLGLYNETRDIDLLRTFIFLPTAVYNEIWRDVYSNMAGGGLNFRLPFGLSSKFQFGTMNFDNNNTGYSLTFETFMKNLNLEPGNSYSGVAQWESDFGLKLKFTYNEYSIVVTGTPLMDVSFNKGPIETEIVYDYMKMNYDHHRSFVSSVEYTRGDLVLAAEYLKKQINYKYEMRGEMTDVYPSFMGGQTVVTPLSEIGTSSYDSYEYYFSATYLFTDWFQLGAYYSYTRSDAGGTMIGYYVSPNPHPDYHNDRTISGRFNIIENQLFFKCEYHYIDGTVRAYDTLNPDEDGDGNADLNSTTHLFAGKIIYMF